MGCSGEPEFCIPRTGTLEGGGRLTSTNTNQVRPCVQRQWNLRKVHPAYTSAMSTQCRLRCCCMIGQGRFTRGMPRSHAAFQSHQGKICLELPWPLFVRGVAGRRFRRTRTLDMQEDPLLRAAIPAGAKPAPPCQRRRGGVPLATESLRDASTRVHPHRHQHGTGTPVQRSFPRLTHLWLCLVDRSAISLVDTARSGSRENSTSTCTPVLERLRRGCGSVTPFCEANALVRTQRTG